MPHRKRPSSSSSGRSTSERNKKHSSHRRHEKSSKKHSKERSRTRHTSRSRSSTRHRSSTTNNEHKSFQTTSVIATTNQFLNKEAVWKHLEVEIQKRKDRIEQCRAEHRIKLGIDKAKQQSAAKGKSWSLEVDRDNDEGDLQNVVIPQVSLTRDVAATRICASIEKVEDDEEDSLDKFMENITKEVKGFHENNTKAITTIKQEQFENNSKRSVIKIITKIVKNQSVEPSGRVPTSNSHHDNSSIIKTEPMDINDQPFSGPSYVTVHSDVVKPGKGKGLLMEQDMDGLEYSSEEDVESMSAIRKEKSKLDKMTTNHDKMYYRPFRKVFYTDISEIANMTEAEVAAYREELDGIKVVGKQCPRPIKTWSQCLTSAKILQSLKKYKYEKPTPIQAQALPIILSGRNMIGIAKTGSGKTLAFILPMFRHIIDQPPLAHGDGPIAVILTPTRELALQTAEECKKFGKSLDIRCIAVYGGKSISTQIAELKRGAEIIVCTPGRLVDMLTVNNGRITNVRRVTYVVVDEADRMFDMGFGPQVTKILDSIRPDRQIVMFSATFPKKMEVLARKYVDKPIEITVGGRSIVCKDIVQNVIILNDDEEKYLKLLELLGIYQSQGSILVFVDTQEHADELMKKVMTHFYSCMSLHGGIDQCDRDSIITDFKNGDIPIIIATSVAARGLDVKNLILVVNYDCPNHYEDYVHRCGRTGRAGNRGYAYTFITPTQERYAGNIIQALKTSDAFVPDELTLLWDGYAEKQKTMGIQVKACVGGFSGRGNNQFDRLKNQQTGLRDSVDLDEDEESQLVDQQIQSFFNKTKKCIEAKINTLINQNEETNGSSTVNDLPSKIELAKKVAARLTSNKSETRNSIQKTTTSLFQHDSVSGLIVAQQRANELNRKLNYQKAEEKMEFTENISQIFEDELEINDFPQNVRSKVMNKGILAHICEYADVDIFVRGQYYPNNKEVLQTDRKLYLKIESLTERALQLAKEEITRLIKEEIMKMQNPAQQLTNRARYKV